jgi:hypothetical protein
MTLTMPSSGAIFSLNTDSVPLGYEMLMGFRLSQDTTHLDHPLKATE